MTKESHAFHSYVFHYKYFFRVSNISFAPYMQKMGAKWSPIMRLTNLAKTLFFPFLFLLSETLLFANSL